MRSSRAPAVLMAVVVPMLALLGSTALAETSRFRGEVARGDTVLHTIEHGGQVFEFRLLPASDGWVVWVGDPVNRDRNLVAAATLPLRGGVNPAVIEGWHFRNKDNTGPNEPGPKGVDAPQMRREFAFVLNGADFVRARQALETLLRRKELPAKEVEAAKDALAAIPKARGTLIIEALELSSLAQGEHAFIERMAFSVTIEWPRQPG